MPRPLRLLCIHGLGDHRQSPWKEDWEAAIRQGMPAGAGLELDLEFFTYDDIFEKIDVSPAETMRAVYKLIRSALGGTGLRTRGLVDTSSDLMQWYAGYVVAWVENEPFRKQVRRRLHRAIARSKPDAVLGHSLGSLIGYDALSDEGLRGNSQAVKAVRAHLKKLTYVSLGSQIGNPFVVGNLMPGRIEPLAVKFWHHLYNEEDDVFTAPIRLAADNFNQVNTCFDVEGFADHGAVHYLAHPATTAEVWGPMADEAAGRPGPFPAARLMAGKAARRTPRRRALLIGIDDYPNPADRLEGCVNDAFLVSEVLQQCGFSAGQIRVCLNRRATADAIRSRLDWLLADARAEDELVFYYSGHGARLPTYGEGDQVDRMDETLVPADFDWSPATSVTDDQIFGLYSQLPYETRLAMIFDCCHSGGLHRDGGARARGIDPPDDIRHRALQWDEKLAMWKPRKFEPLNADFSTDAETQREFVGESGSVVRLGRSMHLRQLSQAGYKRIRRRRDGGPVGPYLPVILQACQEDQLAYEYRHGVTSFGAFTYSLVHILRSERRISFQNLVKAAAKRLAELGYDQRPAILGPQGVLKADVPWKTKR